MRSFRFAMRAILLALCSAIPLLAQEEAPLHTQVRQRLEFASKEHPRLFLDAAGFAALRERLAGDELLRAARDTVLADADAIFAAEPVRREQVGRRLLGVSRTCLKRVVCLAFAWQVTGEQRYAKRAATEMRSVAAFSDWNPSHFLDVAEMTAALAIGYDWLHAALSVDDRATIRTALLDLGLRPSLEGGWWVDTTNNWNQVCHGSLSLGALAVHEDEPELATRILARAVRKLPRAMGEYAPDGAYPEGPGYWNYGSGYNAIALAAFESVLDTDFGLADDSPGFLDTPRYYLHVTGPTGLFFNYSDCGARGEIAPAMYWFAQRLDDPGLLHHELGLLRARIADHQPSAEATDRLFPLALLWCPPLEDVPAPAANRWSGQGTTPVALLRSGWDADATFVGIKAGSPGANHAHMDAGSFVIDALGTRWADDLGAQSYHSLESRGIDLWNRSQGSERWTVFRLSTAAHNVLMVDGAQQRVDGKARLLPLEGEGDRLRAIVDLEPVYRGQLATVRRGIEILDDGSVRIEDAFSAPEAAGRADRIPVRWGMLTRAEVELVGPRRALLRRDGAQVELVLEEPAEAHWELVDTGTPRAAHDQANPGTSMLAFTVSLPDGGDGRAQVLMKVGKGPVLPGRPLEAARKESPTPGESSDPTAQAEPVERADERRIEGAISILRAASDPDRWPLVCEAQAVLTGVLQFDLDEWEEIKSTGDFLGVRLDRRRAVLGEDDPKARLRMWCSPLGEGSWFYRDLKDLRGSECWFHPYDFQEHAWYVSSSVDLLDAQSEQCLEAVRVLREVDLLSLVDGVASEDPKVVEWVERFRTAEDTQHLGNELADNGESILPGVLWELLQRRGDPFADTWEGDQRLMVLRGYHITVGDMFEALSAAGWLATGLARRPPGDRAERLRTIRALAVHLRINAPSRR